MIHYCSAMIKKIIIMAVGLLMVAMAAAQSYRVSYAYYYKTEPDAEGYRADMDMKLDIVDGKGVFYSEKQYLKDSLMVLTFDENGNTKDEDLYRRLAAMPAGCSETAFIDYSGMRFTQNFNFPGIKINGTSNLEMPQWRLTDEVNVSKEGYNVRKAIVDYLGREWSVWYTEDIPLPYGPWALWGTPGLVIMAEDSESLFMFRFSGLEEIKESDRYSLRWDYCHKSRYPRERVYDLGLIDAFSMYTNLMTNQSYQNQLLGIGEAYFIDNNGSRTEIDGFPYIPLVPLSYKTK